MHAVGDFAKMRRANAQASARAADDAARARALKPSALAGCVEAPVYRLSDFATVAPGGVIAPAARPLEEPAQQLLSYDDEISAFRRHVSR